MSNLKKKWYKYTILSIVPFMYGFSYVFDINMEHITLAVIGMIMHKLLKVMTVKDIQKHFNFDFWMKDNVFSILFTTCSILVLFIVTRDIFKMNDLFSFTIGYNTDSVFKSIMKNTTNKITNQQIENTGYGSTESKYGDQPNWRDN